MNNTFEDQLTASARRLRKAQDDNLPIDKSPRVKSRPISSIRHYWGWVATPIAAAVGLLIGIFINQPAEENDPFKVPVVVTESSGHNILDDGIDYSLFFAM